MKIALLDPAKERSRDSVNDKDAVDVLRLMQAVDTRTLAAGLAQLSDHELSAAVTAEAVSQLKPFAGSPEAPGVSMAICAARPDAEPEVISTCFTVLVSDLLTALTVGRSTLSGGRDKGFAELCTQLARSEV